MTKPDERIDGIYKPRKPKETAFYNCVENHIEGLESVWDDQYAPRRRNRAMPIQKIYEVDPLCCPNC